MPNSTQLALSDFAFVNDKEIGCLTYQCHPYMILVGRGSYAITYKGQTIGWGYESITEALRGLNNFIVQRAKAREIFAKAQATRRAQ